jgi:hypothetical protein
MNELTLEKMRNLIMETAMCRKDKNCGSCKRVNFCAIWNNRWPDHNVTKINGISLEAYSDYKVKDLPILVVNRIADSVDKTFHALITYMSVNNLLFDTEQGYTNLIKRDG